VSDAPANIPASPVGRPVIGVGVVVWKDGRVLLIERATSPMRGQWSLPGGRQKPGETVTTTARRELQEETGVTVGPLRLVDVVDFIDRDDNGNLDLHYTLIDYTARWQGGPARAGDDAAAVKWADARHLDGYDLWAETRRVIEKSRVIMDDRS